MSENSPTRTQSSSHRPGLPLAADLLLLTAVLIIIALNLRPALASIGPLLTPLQADLQMSYTSASWLTILPIIAMGVACFSGFALVRWLGFQRTLSLALLLITLATAARWWVGQSTTLILSALVVGAGIAIVQAIVPALIKANFAERTPTIMGFYVTAIMAGAAIAASLSPTLATLGDWHQGLAYWALLGVVALLVWFAIRRHPRIIIPTATTQQAKQRYLNNPRAWQLAVFFGTATGCYVCALTWLAPAAMELNYSEQQAGLLVGFLTFMEVVAGLLFPWWASKVFDRRPILMVLAITQMLGFIGMACLGEDFLLLSVALAGLGMGGTFPMALIVTMDHHRDPLKAGQLAAFVQGVGYLLGGIAPWLAAAMREQLAQFQYSWWVVVASSLLLLALATQFNPRHYAEKMSVKDA
ncbi:MFS transporter [Idiomarina xiamenensis]|nr:MFS transporter [Idiomarina xiamenensis]